MWRGGAGGGPGGGPGVFGESPPSSNHIGWLMGATPPEVNGLYGTSPLYVGSGGSGGGGGLVGSAKRSGGVGPGSFLGSSPRMGTGGVGESQECVWMRLLLRPHCCQLLGVCCGEPRLS
jgi:hypothetical protein